MDPVPGSNRSLRLAFVLTDYFPHGGLQRDCLGIARLAVERGHRVTIFCRTWTGDLPLEPKIVARPCSARTNLARNRQHARNVRKALVLEEFDAVVSFNRLDVPMDFYFAADPCYIVRAQRDKSWWRRSTARHREFLRIESKIFREGTKTRVFLLTDKDIEAYRQHYRTETERFCVLPPAVQKRDLDLVTQQRRRVEFRDRFGLGNDSLLVLFVGTGFRVKGLDRALRAVAALPEYLRARTRFMVIGAGKSKPYEKLAKNFGISKHVEFAGGRHDVFDWQCAADVQLHPAISESGGMVLLEAITAGLPVLTTDTCGYAKHVERAKAGTVLASPFRQEECNSALLRLLNLNAGERTVLIEQTLDYAAETDLYSCHETAVDTIELYIRPKNRIDA